MTKQETSSSFVTKVRLSHFGHARRGVVLIVVLGILVVLSLLGTTFAIMQRTERVTSRNYLDSVRAKLLAQSGVEDGLARLRNQFPYHAWDNGKLASLWKYYGDSLDGSTQDLTVPLVWAKHPSFAYAPGGPAAELTATLPQQIAVEGRKVGFSGVMDSGTYATHSDLYSLKVLDLSGCIYVNDGVDQGPGGSVSQNLKRILNQLGEVVKVSGLGTKILAARPPGGYMSKLELLKAVGYDEVQFAKFREYVTTYAWVDKSVANPVPLSATMAANPDYYKVSYFRGSPPIFRLGHPRDGSGAVSTMELMCCPPAASTDPSIRVFGLDTLNPQWIEIVGRAPVNVNSAARPVLVALLADLKGFFLSDRRRNNPRWSGDLYLSFRQVNTFSAAGHEGDEVGFLYSTNPIQGGSSTTAGGLSAYAIADEIVACRERRTSPNPPYFGYGGVSWSGPFRSWRQWNKFCDNLAQIGVLYDDRPIYFDYDPSSCDATGFGALIPSEMQKRFAAQALADMLKANFNPKTHLNVLNPDENLYTIVDKSELIVNSTEFCFLPTGYFEVESIGRVLRPEDGYDAFASSNNRIMAQARAVATIKLYDIYRETNQKQFQQGTLAGRTGAFETNNNKSVEIGPEPDNGVAPSQNEWDGYIALPTVGGNFHSPGGSKKADTLMRTTDLPNVSEFNSVLHNHFSWDFSCHGHGLGVREDLSSHTLPDEHVENFPCWPASYPGPYDPTMGPAGTHRLAKSFRTSSGGTMPSLLPYAPSNLHIDGGYSERHSAPSYATSKGADYIWRFSDENAQGMVSFWVKPFFHPEMTGKVRSFWDLSRYHTPCGSDVHVWPFALRFFPTHFNPAVSEVNEPKYWSNNIGKFHPSSLVFGSKAWHDVPDTHSFGNITQSLNHIGHPDEGVKPSILKANRWLNVAFQWHLTGEWEMAGTSSTLYINGSTAVVPYTFSTMTGWPSGYTKMWYFDHHDGGGERNHMRLGNPSKICEAAGVPFRGNYVADSTIDELYVWRKPTDANPLTLWIRGRYYKPLNQAYGEGLFTSQAIPLSPCAVRVLAPASTTASPTATGGTTVSTTTSASLLPEVSKVRLLGVSWSWSAEDVDASLTPVLYDHNNSLGTVLDDVHPKVEVSVKADGVTHGPYSNDGFSPARSTDGGPIVVTDPNTIHYLVRFKLESATLSTILLATPIVDDVTIFWDCGHAHVVSYVFDNRVF